MKKTCIDAGLSHKKIENFSEDYGCEQSDFVQRKLGCH